jgi:folate-dependent phosphoribosylglycinamide formyltransferase PurN
VSDLNKKILQIGLIVDSDSIDRWQFDAIANCSDILEINTIIYCQNSQSKKNLLKHMLYYLLNLLSIRNRQTTQVAWSKLTSTSSQIFKFNCHQTGNWQTIDVTTQEKLAEKNLDLIVKFGMNLLRDPNLLRAKYGVLSFHHGDPTKFRGRPAGFYELKQHVDEIGAVVQGLSNHLDAGQIRAFGKYQIYTHSYRRTLEALYANSASLLRQAILNCLDERTLNIVPSGKNYRLPTNFGVMHFSLLMIIRKVKRLFFGLFQHRQWQIAQAEHLNFAIEKAKTEIPLLKTLPIPRGVGFIADPFVLPNGEVICEATTKNSQRGFLMTIDNAENSRIKTSILGKNHLSFPFVVKHADQLLVMPEMAANGSQVICELNQAFEITKVHSLQGLENDRLIDPVLLFKDSKWWLFAGKSGNEADHLFLWSSENIYGPYVAHRMNPIVVDPSRARNAGAFFNINNELFRLGQDNRHDYGDGITVCRVTQLNDMAYDESPVTRLMIAGHKGPHTLSTNGSKTYVDYYDKKFSPIAWLARVKAQF